MNERLEALSRRIEADRARWLGLQWLRASGVAAAWVVGAFLVAVLADHWLRLPMLGRFVAAAGVLGAVAMAGRVVWRRWRVGQPTADEIALAIERRSGGVENRLINALQIGRSDVAAAPASGGQSARPTTVGGALDRSSGTLPERDARRDDGREAGAVVSTPAAIGGSGDANAPVAGGQSARPTGTLAESVADALVRENWDHLQSRPLPGSLAMTPALVAVGLAGALLLVLGIGWATNAREFKTAASRILLPFASIDPLYFTVLKVEPGDIEAMGDVPVKVTIRGERPSELALLLESADRRSSVIVPVPAGNGAVTCTIPNVVRSLTYAVRGGDYTSPYYRIEVPAAPRVARVAATIHYPEYVKLAPKTAETSGDLEALRGSRVELKVTLDQPVDAATLIVRNSADRASTTREPARVPLTRAAPTEFRGELKFEEITEYRLEMTLAGRTPPATTWHAARVVPDEAPKVELSGVPTTGEIGIDAPVTLRLSAADDFGITRFGVYARRAPVGGGGEGGSGRRGEEEKTHDAEHRATLRDEGWTKLGEWACDGSRKAADAVEFLASSVGAVEGDRWEFVARAADAYPGRKGEMVSGPVVAALVVGDGTQLQLLYEQILRSEAELTGLIGAAQKQHQESDRLVRRLDAGELVDDETAPRVKELLDWTTARAADHAALRETASRAAREMANAAGSLRMSLGMLADTEMVRTGRVFDSVATRDDAKGRRTAFAEVRATQQRTVQSLQQILDQYVRFRQDWELAHMTPFVRMLADRQASLRDQSRQRADENPAVTPLQRDSSARRQTKVGALCELTAVAITGLAERTQEIDPDLSEAYAGAAEGLDAEELKTSIATASMLLKESKWDAAASEQTKASDALAAIVTALQEAQSAASKRLLAAMEERSESELAAQGDLEKLKQGITEDLLDEPDGLKLKDLIHKAEVAQDKSGTGKPAPYVDSYLFPDSAVAGLQRPDTGKRQQFDILKLGTAPGTTPSFPQQSDRQGNRVKPHIQEEFEDLVGDLLEEEDEMKKNYETLNLNAAFNINEPGEIGKQGGDLNSTAAAAATGNQKPPTTNFGGASRVGRQGARAYGAAVGKESINRRGRDKVQEGQERAPDQAGSVKETKSEDPQEDTSTGTGGRKVESDDAKFSQNDAGEFTEDMVGRMDKAKETFHIVERQGKGIDAKVAEAMRDMNSRQEQTLERLKSIRKELKNLYLPTEQLDDLIARMQANLHSLSERPSADVYHLQQKTLDELRGALQVFHQAHSGFQASLPREQQVRGRVLDAPARTPPPGYEDAVRDYYRRLASP